MKKKMRKYIFLFNIRLATTTATTTTILFIFSPLLFLLCLLLMLLAASVGSCYSWITQKRTHIREMLSRFAPMAHNYMQKTISLIEINLARGSICTLSHSFRILFIQLDRITHFLLFKLRCFIWFYASVNGALCEFCADTFIPIPTMYGT